MSDERLTVRFTKEELAGIASRAQLMELSKTEVVRLAVHKLFTSASSGEKVDKSLNEMRSDLTANGKSQFNQICEYQQRTTRLLLKVLQAPKEAEDALEKILEIEMKPSDEETSDSVAKWFVLAAMGALLFIPAIWLGAWKYESMNFDANEKSYETSFALGYLCEEVVPIACRLVRNSRPVQIYHWSKDTQPSHHLKMAVAAKRAFIFPWPELGLAVVIVLGLLIKKLVDGDGSAKK